MDGIFFQKSTGKLALDTKDWIINLYGWLLRTQLAHKERDSPRKKKQEVLSQVQSKKFHRLHPKLKGVNDER